MLIKAGHCLYSFSIFDAVSESPAQKFTHVFHISHYERDKEPLCHFTS